MPELLQKAIVISIFSKVEKRLNTLTYVSNNQLMVVITGKNVNTEELRRVAENLNLKV